MLLKCLESWFPHSELDLKKLTFKISSLLVLLSGKRGNTVVNIWADNVNIYEDEVRIAITELTKTTSIGKHEPEIIIKKFKNEKLCFIRCLEHIC